MKIILFLVLLALVQVSFSQGSDLAKAFTKSYTEEYSGEYASSIKSLKEVYDDKSYELNLRLGWLSYMAGLFTESQAYYQKTINILPYSIEAKLGFIYPASALGSWDIVIKQYEAILNIDPQNSIANYRLGSIYYGREDYQRSYRYLEKVVNLYPFSYDGLILFAWCNYRLGKLKEARVLFNKTLLLSPGDPSATEGLGMIK
jgi:tetratricopeptide (TPR) repeat protein